MQGTPITVYPDDNGRVEIQVGEEGTTIVVTFTPDNPEAPISVGLTQVTACAEPGMCLLQLTKDVTKHQFLFYKNL